MARPAATAARTAPRRAPARAARSTPGRALPRRVSGSAPPRGAAAVALPGRIMRAPFARAARTRASGVLDALLQGRAWIALVGVLLAGIVFFNVDLLQLNRDIAQTAQRAASVKRENARLRLEVARLASTERIQEVAARRGLELPAPGDVRYLRADPAEDARNAAARITAPGAEGAQPVPQAPQPAPTTRSQPQQTVPPQQGQQQPQQQPTTGTPQQQSPQAPPAATGPAGPTGAPPPPAGAPGGGAPAPTAPAAGGPG
jgi:cell division protein FtsL